MKVLIVYAHPDPHSFNGAMKDAAVADLTAAGHEVRVSDLYAMKFNPVVDPSQFPERMNPELFQLQKEQRHAAETKTIAPDVAAEQEKLLWADLIIFQFPLWWGSMPAIMKGWVDRVFSVGTVYGRGTTGLQGRKALLAVTASGGGDRTEAVAHYKAELSHVLNNVLALPRFEVLEPFFGLGVSHTGEAERETVLAEYRAYLKSVTA